MEMIFELVPYWREDGSYGGDGISARTRDKEFAALWISPPCDSDALVSLAAGIKLSMTHDLHLK